VAPDGGPGWTSPGNNHNFHCSNNQFFAIIKPSWHISILHWREIVCGAGENMNTRRITLGLCLLIIAGALILLCGLSPDLARADETFWIYLPITSKPDLSWIAYVSRGVGCPGCPLEIIHPDGTGRTRLTTGFYSTSSPAWSPDGSQLVFNGNIYDPVVSFAIYRIDVDGTNLTRLIDLTSQVGGMSWSHDGAKIAFGYESDIYIMNADGTGLTQLTSDGNFNSAPVWSPDDQLIAFNSERSAKPGIYVMEADGSNQRLLGSASFHEAEPSWSPDGTQIAFVRVLETTKTAIMVMEVDGTGEYELVNSESPFLGSTWGVGGPSWSPDGQKIAFCFSEFHFVDMGILDASGDDFKFVNADGCPEWSP
jgi:Tol biopolymer transport system component